MQPAPVRTPPPAAAVAPRERDLAQRAGDFLFPLVAPARESYRAAFVVVLLFGLTLPIVLLRQSFDVRWRLGLSVAAFWAWASLINALF
jgi:hypothetical protein